MKRLGLLLMMVVLVSTVSIAQNRSGQRSSMDPEESAKTQTAELKKFLDLNKDQEKKVYELNLKAGKEFAEMRKNMQDGDRDAMREKFTKSREETNKEMKKILTEAQFKKYEAYLKEQQEKELKEEDRGRGIGNSN